MSPTRVSNGFKISLRVIAGAQRFVLMEVIGEEEFPIAICKGAQFMQMYPRKFIPNHVLSELDVKPMELPDCTLEILLSYTDIGKGW